MVTLQGMIGQELVEPGPLGPRSVLRSCFMDCAKASRKIPSHFRIPPLGHLGPLFTRTILNVDLATLAVMLPQIDTICLRSGREFWSYDFAGPSDLANVCSAFFDARTTEIATFKMSTICCNSCNDAERGGMSIMVLPIAGTVIMGVGLRLTPKGVDGPPDPTVDAPVLDPTDEGGLATPVCCGPE